MPARRAGEKEPTNNCMDITIEEIKQLAGISSCAEKSGPGPWEIGKNYCIRTVTMIQTGRLVEVHPIELVLEDAAWIADTGRWADFLVSGKINEVEPFPSGRVIVGRMAVIDAVSIGFNLPRSQK